MKLCLSAKMFHIRENVFSRHTSTKDVRLSNCTCSWERAPWLKLASPVFLNNSLAFSSKLDSGTWWSSKSVSRARSLSNWDAFSLGPGWGVRGARTSLSTASIQHLSWAALCRKEPHWETVHSKRLGKKRKFYIYDLPLKYIINPHITYQKMQEQQYLQVYVKYKYDTSIVGS